MKNNGLRHIRTLYILFAGILILCLTLFLSNVFRSDEHSRLAHFPETDPAYAFRITDLAANDDLYDEEQVIEGTAQGISAHTHINRFEVDIFTDDDRIGSDPRIKWVNALQWLCLLSVAAIFVLVVIVLFSLYRSARRDQLFPKRNSMLLSVIGLLLTFTSLALDTSAYLEQTVIVGLLRNTTWQPEVHFTLHFTRIFFGLTLIFLAQIFRIGRQLQEEHELTI